MNGDHEMPTVIIGHDMPAELAADVSSTLAGMGVVVKANGVAPQPRELPLVA